MKRILLAITAISLLAVVSYVAYRRLASDETKIAWLLHDAAAAFDSMHRGGCLAAFHDDFTDSSTPVVGQVVLDRAILGQVLLLLFTRDVDRGTGEFRYRVHLPEDRLQIEVADDTATATFELQLERRTGDEWKPAWEVRITAELLEEEGSWLIRRSSHQTLSGRRPR